MAGYVVGRDGKFADIVVPDAFPAVSRRHLRITPLGDDKYRLEDLDSTGGTRVKQRGGWLKITHHDVTAVDEIRLANFETTVQALLEGQAKATVIYDGSPIGAAVVRNPAVAGSRIPEAAVFAPSPSVRPEPATGRDPNTAYDVFISYSQEDRDRVRPLVQLLEQKGWRVFWDAKLRPGDQFSEHIDRAMRSARVAVVVWSNAAVKSQWVRAEAEQARELGILVPVRIDRSAIPLPFGSFQTADLTQLGQPESQQHVRQFLETVAAMTQTALPDPSGASLGFVSPGTTTKPKLDWRHILLDLDGRITRREFWFGILATVPVGILVNLVIGALFQANEPSMSALEKAGGSATIYFLVALYFNIALLGKRIHDFGRSAWWSAPILLVWMLATVLSAQAPFGGPELKAAAGIFAFIGCACWLIVGLHRGDQRSNTYGEARLIK